MTDTQARLAARLLATYLPDETPQTNPSHVASGGEVTPPTLSG